MLHNIVITVKTIAVGALGAFIAWFFGMPAPFITGPAIFVSVASLAGLKTDIPVKLRDMVFLAIGITLGASVTPEILAAAGNWPISLAIMCFGTGLIMIVGGWIFQRAFNTNRKTALLCSTPGHLSYVLSFGTDIGADTAIISVIQSIRLLLLTLLVPVAIAVLTDADMSMRAPIGAVMPPIHLAVLTILSGILGFGLLKLKVPAAFLLAGMFFSSLGHGVGVITGGMPITISTTAFVLIGALMGTRFSGVTMALLRRAALGGLFITAFGLVVAMAAAMLAHLATGLPLVWVIIAFAPGGFETMVAMAGVIGADPAFVAFHHVSRLFFLSAFVPIALSWKSAER
ncbi:MAG: AbrB family transcriptional regulator [Rhodobacteraceae bacterium]|nr:AbrB family transcriptional regulator [Paracoccaceae bacterium]